MKKVYFVNTVMRCMVSVVEYEYVSETTKTVTFKNQYGEEKTKAKRSNTSNVYFTSEEAFEYALQVQEANTLRMKTDYETASRNLEEIKNKKLLQFR